MTNPLLDFSGLPKFDVIKPEHVTPAIDELIADAKAALALAERIDDVSWATLITPLDRVTERVDHAFGAIGHLQSVLTTAELREAYNENLPKISEFSTTYGQSLHLYQQFKHLAASSDYASYDEAHRKAIENALRDFRLSGAELPPEEKARLAEIEKELSALSSKFSQNVLDATDAFEHHVDDVADLSGIPDDIIAACREAALAKGKTGWLLSLQMPVMQAVLTYADNRGLRELMFRASGMRASEKGPDEFDNSSNIRRILELRHEMAGLLGFASFAEYALVTRMAESPVQVLSFLRDLASRALPSAKKDRDLLETFALEAGLDAMEPWDMGYLSERLRQTRFKLSSQEVKNYFTLPKVLDGLFTLVTELYGIHIVEDEAAVWHPSVRFFRAERSDGSLIGQFYMDLFARSGKNGGAWMRGARDLRLVDNRLQTPLLYLVCNFGEGVDGRQATLSHGDVITLFHEMGHALHQLLTQVDVSGVSGLNGVEWDAIELPSQFMENFCWEWARLSQMTAHVDTGKPLPRDLYDRMVEAKNFQRGFALLRQMEMSLFDIEIHLETFDPRRDDVMSVLEEIRDEVAVNRLPSWHRFPHVFTHIFSGSYAAGYYSYTWAEVLSADAYAAFEEASDKISETGKRFWNEVLARGGSRPSADNFRAFRGREPRIDALLRHNGLAVELAPGA